MLDRNTWNHLTACKLFGCDRNIWYHNSMQTNDSTQISVIFKKYNGTLKIVMIIKKHL